jgi:hypothetical protein
VAGFVEKAGPCVKVFEIYRVRLSEGAMSIALYVIVLFLTLVPSILRVSRLNGSNSNGAFVLLVWCWPGAGLAKMIAARISGMVKIPFAWRVDDCSWAWRAGFGRGRSEARRPSQGGVLGVRA